MKKEEKKRLKSLYKYEEAAYKKGFNSIAGVDEAGRGCLFGPVVAAACIIPKGLWIEGVNDSKKLLPETRLKIFDQIKKTKIAYAIGIVSAEEIDRTNIYRASILAMKIALEKLDPQPEHILVDGGVSLDEMQLSYEKIIGGDALSYSIAAASIIAKVTRDELLQEYHREWPHYGFDTHKGYATKKHLEALDKFGPTPLHRYSFEPIAGY